VVAAVRSRRRPFAPLVWVILTVLSVATALGWPAGPLIVGGVVGGPFEIGPLLPGWSVRQVVRPERGPELFVGFRARPTAGVQSPPTLELRLERHETVLWADRLHLTGQGMIEYVATFPVPTDGSGYTLAVRVLEASGGGVILGGVDIGEPTATTQLTLMGQPLRGFLALGHRMFQRVPPAQHLEAVASALEGWTVAVTAGIGVLGALIGAWAAVLVRRVHGQVVAVVTAVVGVAALTVWLFVAAVHLSVPSVAGVHIGVLRGLTPTGIAALLAFPVVVLAGGLAVVLATPRAAVGSAGTVMHSLRHSALVGLRNWNLAPIPLGGAAAAAVTQDATEVATALAMAAIGVALLGMIVATARLQRQ